MKNDLVDNKTMAVSIVALCAFLTACSNSVRIDTDTALAEEAIKDAHAVDAERLAALEFANAKDRLAEARQALEDDELEQARRLLEAATLEAELAEIKAKATRRQQAAEELEAGNQRLIDELKY